MGITKLLMVLVGGLTAVVLLLLHPAGPGIVLLAVTPFDALWTAFFGVLGNGVTYLPIGAMLLRTNPSLWIHILTGSRIQVAILVFLVGILFSHVMVAPSQGIVAGIAYARKVTLFLIVGLLVWSWRKPEYLALSVRVLVLSTALYALINMADFYLGIQILPQVYGQEIEGVEGREYASNLANEFRLRVVGLPINRWAAWLLLPIMLSVGWLTHARSVAGKLTAAACALVLVVSELSTISRSGLASMAAGLLIVAALAFHLRPVNFVLLILGAALLGGGAMLAVDSLGLAQVFESRLGEGYLGGSVSGRWYRTQVGFLIFARNPVVGVGINNFEVFSRPLIQGAPDAHNSYIHVLAELGLMGFLPFMAILGFAALRLLRSARGVDSTYEHFRPYFLAGFAANCIHMLVHSYEYERVLWIAIAFAATYDRVARSVPRAEARKEAPAEPGAPAWVDEGLSALPRTSDA